MSCVFSLLLETSLTALARHLLKVLTSYSNSFGQGKMGLKFICRKMISAHLGKIRYLESISRKIPYLNFSEFCVLWIQIHRNTSQASNVTNKRHILNQFAYIMLKSYVVIVYTYELVMRAIASLLFPETWTMTRREAVFITI